MYTPKTFAQAQEVIRTYEERVQQQHDALDCLTGACVSHIEDALPYRVLMLPADLASTCLFFTGRILVWTTHTHNDGTYYTFRYGPLQTLQVDVTTFPRDEFGDALPLICWRGVLWVPTYAAKLAQDDVAALHPDLPELLWLAEPTVKGNVSC
jgi:hypothetical protein